MIIYRSWSQVAALSFDLDDTLYDNQPALQAGEAAQQQYLANLGIDQDWWPFRQRLLQQQPELRHDVSQLRYLALVELLRTYHCENYMQHAQLACTLFRETRSAAVHIPTQTHALLTELAKHRPLIALTNGNVDVQRIGLEPYFQYIGVAGQAGRQKPAPDLFVAGQQALRLPFTSIMHVGDHSRSDILGGKRVGMLTAYYNPTQKKAAIQLPNCEIFRLNDLLNL